MFIYFFVNQTLCYTLTKLFEIIKLSANYCLKFVQFHIFHKKTFINKKCFNSTDAQVGKFIEAEAKLNKTSNRKVGKANCFHELSLQTVTRIKPIFLNK